MEPPSRAERHTVFITGGTGYVGSRLILRLIEGGHRVRALVRPESVRRLPAGAEGILGDALDATSFAGHVQAGDTFVQLVGAPHPAPWKSREFRTVDLVSVRESLTAATRSGVAHFVYLSVAQPAPAMRAYIQVREWCEIQLRATTLNATILRPWYILGPGHYWPLLLIPVYRLLEMFSQTRDGARRLGLVTIGQMVTALTWVVEHPATGVRIMDVPAIRQCAPKDA